MLVIIRAPIVSVMKGTWLTSDIPHKRKGNVWRSCLFAVCGLGGRAVASCKSKPCMVLYSSCSPKLILLIYSRQRFKGAIVLHASDIETIASPKPFCSTNRKPCASLRGLKRCFCEQLGQLLGNLSGCHVSPLLPQRGFSCSLTRWFPRELAQKISANHSASFFLSSPKQLTDPVINTRAAPGARNCVSSTLCYLKGTLASTLDST